MHHLNVPRITHGMYNRQTLMTVSVLVIVVSEDPWKNFQK